MSVHCLAAICSFVATSVKLLCISFLAPIINYAQVVFVTLLSALWFSIDSFK